MTVRENRYWTAFYTKPRNEKKIAQRLVDAGFEIYCPMRTVLKQWSDRKKKVKEVLFTSYIFANVSENERQVILQDHGIVSSVLWLKKPVHIPSREINAIKRFLNNNPSANFTQSFMAVGQTIMIKSGPLKGEEGIIERRKGNKVILSLSTLGLSLQAEVPESQLI